MLRLERVAGMLVAACLVASTQLAQAGARPEEAVREQYTALLGAPADIERAQASYESKDNIAVIRLNGGTVCISSSIINGFLLKQALPPSSPLRGEVNSLYPEGYQPVSVMDLLYLYTDNGLDLVEGADLAVKLAAARGNAHRKRTEALLRRCVGTTSNGILAMKIDALIGDTGESSALDLGTDTQQRLACLKEAIVDFIHRLRGYANDIPLIPITAPERLKDSHHLLQHKQNLTQLDLTKQLTASKATDGGSRIRTNGMVGALETLLSQIDIRILHDKYNVRYAASAKQVVDDKRYVPPPVTASSLAEWVAALYQIISGPWDGKTRNPACHYVRAITHTEQMVDWLGTKLGGGVLVKISGKAPCLKCSHYIQYATDAHNNRVRSQWDVRTIIGFNTGWRNGTGAAERDKYRYPTKVFNAAPESNVKVRKFRPREGDPLFPNAPGSYDDSDFDDEGGPGISQSKCYAIEGADSYKKRLEMAADGTVSQSLTDRPEGSAVLAP